MVLIIMCKSSAIKTWENQGARFSASWEIVRILGCKNLAIQKNQKYLKSKYNTKSGKYSAVNHFCVCGA